MKDTNKNTTIFITAVTLTVLIFIITMVWFISQPEAVKKETIQYNYYNFTEEGGMWKTTLKRGPQLYDVVLRFNPEQVEEIRLQGGVEKEFFQQPIHITFDPESPPEEMKYLALGAAELSLNIVRGIGLNVTAACTKNVTETCIERPILTCNNTDKSVIHIKAQEPTRIVMEDKCITVQGKGFELIKSIDRLLYHWYGIIHPLEKEMDESFDKAIQQYKTNIDQALNES